MCTTDSVVIRRQIGFFKVASAICVVAKSSPQRIQSPQWTNRLCHLDDAQIESLRSELSTLKSYLLPAYTKITKLHNEWLTLQESSSSESATFNEYIARYDDYRESITNSVIQLRTLDSLLNSVNSEILNRGSHVPSDSSDKIFDKADLAIYENFQRVHNSSTVPPVASDTSLLILVDASILSKLGPPTFDGKY
ncbi:hypothetical protein KIN20_036207 [Parelaphostrongylus tenuis]|uniref:Uncharacterized protein n=1 Tax=Parelaphostrongylus tenuis TaxID=148309 RepID=A0AAD5WLH3_PARTN|nr:hypothetical protein KIN20_036207 [Parelaphostrongylus tenuis]